MDVSLCFKLVAIFNFIKKKQAWVTFNTKLKIALKTMI